MIKGMGMIKGRDMIEGRGMIKGRHLTLYQIFKTTVFTIEYMIKIFNLHFIFNFCFSQLKKEQ
jgi:hypothetical protein